MAFERRFKAIEDLKKEPLFRKCLLPDIVGTDKNTAVFPAVRNNSIDFYYKGGKLFTYDKRNGFTTHHKYASVIRYSAKKPYITDKDLQAVGSFEEGYERIKENCSLYTGVEAAGVSRTYSNFSCARHKRSQHMVVLDIEISLRREGGEEEPEPGKPSRANSDRIDLLLYNNETGLLRFFEAKDFSNNEIRADSEHEPKIVRQMERYRKQLNAAHVREEMLASYKNHVGIINQLFDLKAPLAEPEDIDPEPRLLLFGFDMDQLTGKLRGEVKRLEEDYGVSVYAIGKIKAAKPEALFTGGKKHWPAG